MKESKNLLSALLALVVIATLSLTGCGSDETPPPAPTPEVENPAAPATEVSAPDVSTPDTTTQTPAAEAPIAAADVNVEGLSPEETITTALNALADGQFVVVYDLMPASYGEDVKSVMNAFGNRVDPQIWTEATATLRKASTVLDHKKALLADFALSMQAQPDPEMTQEVMVQQMTDAAEGIRQALASPVADRNQWIEGDLRGMIATGQQQVFETWDAAAQKAIAEAFSGIDGDAPESLQELIDQIEINTVATTADAATLHVQVPNQPIQPLELVAVEGKWIPADIARDWKANIERMLTTLNQQSPNPEQEKQMILGQLGMANGFLDSLEQVETQEELQMMLGSLMSMFGPMMMQQQQGGGAMPQQMPPM